MRKVTMCPDCKTIISPETEPATLLYEEHPLDDNRPHWECAFCGYSQPPSEWTFFAGYPHKQEMPDNQLPLFCE